MCKALSLSILTLVFLSTAVAEATTPPARVVSANFFDIHSIATPNMLSTQFAGVPPAQYLNPTEIHVSNWNNLPLEFLNIPGSNMDLHDSLGHFTSVDVDWIATDVQSGFSWEQPVLSGDSSMMNGSIQSTLQAPTDKIEIHVRDLANSFDLGAGYDVIIYADQDGVGGRQSFFVDDGIHVGAAITMLDVVNNDPLNPRAFDPAIDYDEGTTDGAGTWIRFSGLTGASFTIEALAVGSSPAFVNGFQIVGYHPVVVPEGDLDGDGEVTGIDFLEWQRGFSAGIYTHKELIKWQASYGSVGPVMAATSAVPEPGVGAMLLAAITIATGTIRRRQLGGLA